MSVDNKKKRIAGAFGELLIEWYYWYVATLCGICPSAELDQFILIKSVHNQFVNCSHGTKAK